MTEPNETTTTETTASTSSESSEDTSFHEQARAIAGKQFSSERNAKNDAIIDGSANDNAASANDNADKGSLANDPEKKPGNDNAAAEDDEPVLAKLLKARAQGQKEVGQAQAHAQRIRQEAEAAAQEFLAKAKAQADAMMRDAEAGGRRKLEELLSPEALTARQADEHDPVYKLGKRFEAELQKRDQELAELKKRDAERDAWIRQREQQESQLAQTTAEKNFVSAASEEKFPYMRTLWSEAELLREAHEAIRHGKEAAAEKGERFSCSDADIMQYLEREAKTRLLAKRDSLAKLLGQQVSSSSGSAPQGQRANGPRTLSTSHASERRASPKPVSEMTEEEATNAMRALARKNLRSA